MPVGIVTADPGAVALSLAAVGVAVVLSLLPGAALADRLAGRRSTWSARLVLSFVASLFVVAGLAAALIVVGAFSGVRLALLSGVAATFGVPVVIRWWRSSPVWRPRTLVWAGLLVVPWIVFAGAEGWPPADTLQWYYAGLGVDLTKAGGIPTAVAEWGQQVRWLPDYIVFDVHAEAQRAMLSFATPEAALAAWRVPVALGGVLLSFLVTRLWVGRAVALAGTTAISGTVFFLAKFDAYKPEAAGIVVGLAAMWLVVRGIRGDRRSWVLLGGATLGLDLSVHAIAATVMGLMVAGFAGVEWLLLRRDRARRLDWLVRAAVLGLTLSVAMGVGLQGRAAAAGGALNPGASTAGDPTWTFFLRSTGQFEEPEPPPPARPLAGGVTTPWAGFRVTSAFGWWLIPVTAIGALGAFALAGPRRRAAVLGLGVAAGLVALGVAFFTLAFDTYVPRWTGLVRFGQYVPLLVGLAVTLAAAGYLRAWSWLAGSRIPRTTATIALAVGLVWLIPLATGRYGAEARLSSAGQAALQELRARGRAGDVVVSNALTTGSIEWFTGLEAPFEGRQPLIEEPEVLADANRLLLEGHRWFDDPSDRGFLDDLGVRWVLVVDDRSTLAAPATLGGGVASMTGVPGLDPVWEGDGISLLELQDPYVPNAAADDLRPLVDLMRSFLALAIGAGVARLIVVARRPGRGRSGGPESERPVH